MRYKLSIKPQLFSLLALIIASCNDPAQTRDAEIKDTSKTETVDKPSYDSSRSVTAISPNLYRKLSDTLNIRMLEGTYQPGDSSIMHAHPDFVLYVLEGGTAELTMTDGAKQTIEFKKDMAVVLPAATHSAKNIGKTKLRLIVVEVDRPRN